MRIQGMTYKEFVQRWECGMFSKMNNVELKELVNELILERQQIVKIKNLEYELVLLSI
jgi:hypothetical protein